MMRYLFKKSRGNYFFAGKVVSRSDFFIFKSIIKSLKSPASFESLILSDKVVRTGVMLDELITNYMHTVKSHSLIRDFDCISDTVTYINDIYDSSRPFTYLTNVINYVSSTYKRHKLYNRDNKINDLKEVFGNDCPDKKFDVDLVNGFSDYSLVKEGADYFFSVEARSLTLDKKIGAELNRVSYNRFTKNLRVELATVIDTFKLSEIDSRDYKKSDVTVNNGVLTVKLSLRH